MRVVFDANVITAGVGWHWEGWLCLVKMARRQVVAFGTEQTLSETRETAFRIINELRPAHNEAGRLTRYLDRVKRVQAAPLGKQRSRDAKDDPYLAAALAASAKVIVSYDKDLLDLEKPFGITIVRPGVFPRMVRG
jgi:putative PIN family toxin of toxin-antitoxin system